MSEQIATESPDDGTTRTPGRGENVLVLAASMDPAAEEVCGRLAGGSDGLLLVSVSDDPDRRLNTIAARGGRPDRVAAVSCDSARGAVATATPAADHDHGCTTVTDPGDLTGLGINIDRALESMADLEDPTLCLHSLTTLLQYGEPRQVYRFCHAVTRKAKAAGANAHFHLDPGTVDDRTVRTFRSLFDRTVEP